MRLKGTKLEFLALKQTTRLIVLREQPVNIIACSVKMTSISFIAAPSSSSNLSKNDGSLSKKGSFVMDVQSLVMLQEIVAIDSRAVVAKGDIPLTFTMIIL